MWYLRSAPSRRLLLWSQLADFDDGQRSWCSAFTPQIWACKGGWWRREIFAIQLLCKAKPIGAENCFHFSLQFHPMRAKELVCLLWDNCCHHECFNLSHLRFLLESCQTLLSFKPTSRVSATKSAIIQLPRHERSNARGTKFPPTATNHPI